MRINTYNLIYTTFILVGLILLIVRFPQIMFSIFIVIVSLVYITKTIGKIRFSYALKKRGWGIKDRKHTSFCYVENTENENRELIFECVQIDHVLSEIILPSNEEWLNKTPEWARDKKDIIIKRLIKEFEKDDKYVFPE